MKHELGKILDKYHGKRPTTDSAVALYHELNTFFDSLPDEPLTGTSSCNMVSAVAGVKKQDLLAALKAEGFKDDIGHPLENNLLFQKLVSLIPEESAPEESAPDEGCGVGGVVPVIPAHEVQLVKMQTLHQLLVEQTSYRIGDAEGAAKLAQMVNAAYAAIAAPDMGEVSDGYHTFNELYAHRVRLFSTLMCAYPDQAWWSYLHHDGSKWDGWILAGIDTPAGPVTYHLPISEVPMLPEGTELARGKEWDGHTAADVLERLKSL